MGQKPIFKVTIDEELRELIPGFLENRKNDLLLADDALKQNDFHTIGRIGHSMKGNGAGYGFDEITRLGSDLETAARSASVPQVRAIMEVLSTFLDHLDIHYE